MTELQTALEPQAIAPTSPVSSSTSATQKTELKTKARDSILAGDIQRSNKQLPSATKHYLAAIQFAQDARALGSSKAIQFESIARAKATETLKDVPLSWEAKPKALPAAKHQSADEQQHGSEKQERKLLKYKASDAILVGNIRKWDGDQPAAIKSYLAGIRYAQEARARGSNRAVELESVARANVTALLKAVPFSWEPKQNSNA